MHFEPVTHREIIPNIRGSFSPHEFEWLGLIHFNPSDHLCPTGFISAQETTQTIT